MSDLESRKRRVEERKRLLKRTKSTIRRSAVTTATLLSMALPGKAYANNETINNQADSHTYAVENVAINSGHNKKTATDEERKTFEMLDRVFRELEDNAKNFVATTPEMIKEYMSGTLNSMFELDFTDLDMTFDDDLRKAYDRFFDILKEVQNEYNNKFKNEEGFKELDIFNPDSLFN